MATIDSAEGCCRHVMMALYIAGFQVHGVIGTAINAGDVGDALMEIFENIKPIVKKVIKWDVLLTTPPPVLQPRTGDKTS